MQNKKYEFMTVALDARLQNVASSFDCGAPVYNRFIKGHKAIDPSYGKTYLDHPERGPHRGDMQDDQAVRGRRNGEEA